MNESIDLLNDKRVQLIIAAALDEDLGAAGDVTTKALIPEESVITVELIAKGNYSISGTAIAEAVFMKLDPGLKCEINIPDGNTATSGNVVMKLNGSARGILAAERTALNFIQRMTGIATLTRQFVDLVKQYNVTILDTRKTVPGYRRLDKYAVLCGGGTNHRMGLYDMIMIKDNHRNLWRNELSGDMERAVLEARKTYPEIPIEVEVETEEDLESALFAKPDWILLDNMPPENLKRCVAICAGRCGLEASGGITLENVEAVAKTGINAISLGCLTHSVLAADLSLEIAKNG